MLRHLTPAHHRFLDKIQKSDTKPAGQTEFFIGLRRRLSENPSDKHGLSAAFNVVAPLVGELRVSRLWLRMETSLPGTYEGNNKDPYAAFDWEYSELDGLPSVGRNFTIMLQVGILP